MKVIGVERVDYTSKKTGNPVTGFRLHCSFDKRGCDGVAVESYFCRTAAFDEGFVPGVGDEVDLLYNRYGSVQSVIVH